MKTFAFLAACLALASAGTMDIDLISKVESGQVTNVIIELPQIMDQIDSHAALQSLSGDMKVNALVAMLEGLTSAAQAPFVTRLSELSLAHETFWASNIILVKDVTVPALQMLGAVPGDFVVREEHMTSIYPTIVHNNDTEITQTVQWGISNIRCNAVWSRTQGEGTVAGIIDTGVNEGHTALSGGYAGAWRDPYYSTARPTDQNGHGSHCK